MLKYWLALLVVLNAAALAWQWEVLAPWGLGPQNHHEPERLKQQLRPEAIQPVLAPSGADAAPAQDPTSVAPQQSSAPAEASPPLPSPLLPSLPTVPGATPATPATAPR